MAEERPRISVIVSARDAAATIGETLLSLARQPGIGRAEVLVADGTPDARLRAASAEFPWVRHLACAADTLPALKARAIAAARGEIIAILDPTDVAAPGWLAALEHGLAESGAAALGGTVELRGPPSRINAAGYLFEYGAFAPPLAAGPTDGDLPGNNVAYRRQVFDETCADLLPRGFWKPFFHQRIRERGGALWLHPAMRVQHEIRQSSAAFCARRFHYGRCFGAMRLSAASGVRRLCYLLCAPVAPVLLVVRHFARAARQRDRRRLLLRCAPELVLVCCAWGVGEWLGAWLGPGRSCGMVY